MAVVFQLAVVLLVILIAYWWANQGLFSAILHFVAVVCAGAIALAFWEPLVAGVLLRNSGFDNYAWGLSLLVLFVVSLLAIRYAFDKLAPGNVYIPHWANLAFGGLFGLGSGILTIGIMLIGVGFTQSSTEILGVTMWHREGYGLTTQVDDSSESLWLPAHTWTVEFFEFISMGSFHPEIGGKPLRQVNPHLDRQAWSLVRDSYEKGTGRISIPPDGLEVSGVTMSDDRVLVTFKVKKSAFDRASQFILSSAQIRLIAHEGGNARSGRVAIAHPDRWTQKVSVGGGNMQDRTLIFDDKSHYATTVPGQHEGIFAVEFPIGGANEYGRNIPRGYIPRYLQVKGLRFELPPQQRWERVQTLAGRRSLGEQAQTLPPATDAPMASSSDIQQRNDIRPISVSVNYIVGFTHQDNYLLQGIGSFDRGGRVSPENRVRGVYATPGTQIVQVDVSRGKTTDVYGSTRNIAGDAAAPVLVDSNGGVYYAKGYILSTPDNVQLKLTPAEPIQTVGELPHLPTSGTHELRLFYEVTEGVTLTSFRLGEVPVARCDLSVQIR